MKTLRISALLLMAMSVVSVQAMDQAAEGLASVPFYDAPVTVAEIASDVVVPVAETVAEVAPQIVGKWQRVCGIAKDAGSKVTGAVCAVPGLLKTAGSKTVGVVHATPGFVKGVAKTAGNKVVGAVKATPGFVKGVASTSTALVKSHPKTSVATGLGVAALAAGTYYGYKHNLHGKAAVKAKQAKDATVGYVKAHPYKAGSVVAVPAIAGSVYGLNKAYQAGLFGLAGDKLSVAGNATLQAVNNHPRLTAAAVAGVGAGVVAYKYGNKLAQGAKVVWNRMPSLRRSKSASNPANASNVSVEDVLGQTGMSEAEQTDLVAAHVAQARQVVQDEAIARELAQQEVAQQAAQAELVAVPVAQDLRANAEALIAQIAARTDKNSRLAAQQLTRMLNNPRDDVQTVITQATSFLNKTLNK